MDVSREAPQVATKPECYDLTNILVVLCVLVVCVMCVYVFLVYLFVVLFLLLNMTDVLVRRERRGCGVLVRLGLGALLGLGQLRQALDLAAAGGGERSPEVLFKYAVLQFIDLLVYIDCRCEGIALLNIDLFRGGRRGAEAGGRAASTPEGAPDGCVLEGR